MIKKNSIFLPVALTYETSDINEGRFTRGFVERMATIRHFLTKKDAVKDASSQKEFLENLERLEEARSGEIDSMLASTMAAREHSFVSCWSYRKSEDARMWREFGDRGAGVAIKSTIRKVSNSLEHVMEEYKHNHPGELDLKERQIVYDRQNIESSLNEDNYNESYLLPLFYLDRGRFEHEKEYRFVAFDLEQIFDSAEEKLMSGEITMNGTYVKDFSYRTKTSNKRPRGVEVDIDIESMITEVVLGPDMPAEIKKKIENAIQRRQLDLNISVSTLRNLSGQNSTRRRCLAGNSSI